MLWLQFWGISVRSSAAGTPREHIHAPNCSRSTNKCAQQGHLGSTLMRRTAAGHRASPGPHRSQPRSRLRCGSHQAPPAPATGRHPSSPIGASPGYVVRNCLLASLALPALPALLACLLALLACLLTWSWEHQENAHECKRQPAVCFRTPTDLARCSVVPSYVAANVLLCV